MCKVVDGTQRGAVASGAAASAVPNTGYDLEEGIDLNIGVRANPFGKEDGLLESERQNGVSGRPPSHRRSEVARGAGAASEFDLPLTQSTSRVAGRWIARNALRREAGTRGGVSDGLGREDTLSCEAGGEKSP